MEEILESILSINSGVDQLKAEIERLKQELEEAREECRRLAVEPPAAYWKQQAKQLEAKLSEVEKQASFHARDADQNLAALDRANEQLKEVEQERDDLKWRFEQASAACLELAEEDLPKATQRAERYLSDIVFLLELVPAWADPVPEPDGSRPENYTEGREEVVKRVQAIRQAITGGDS